MHGSLVLPDDICMFTTHILDARVEANRVRIQEKADVENNAILLAQCASHPPQSTLTG